MKMSAIVTNAELAWTYDHAQIIHFRNTMSQLSLLNLYRCFLEIFSIFFPCKGQFAVQLDG